MPKHAAFRIYVTALAATLLMLLVWIFLNHHFDGSVWNGMTISQSVTKVEYCEWNNPAAFFHQRMNTYSNLGYFFLGMIVILVAVYDRKNIADAKNLIQQFPSLSFFFGLCLVYLCFGSAFFHASLTWPGQRMDMNGTYSVCISLLYISFYRFIGQDLPANYKRIWIVILFFVVVVFVQLHLMISSFLLLPLLILIITITACVNYTRNKPRFNFQFALLSLLLLIAAVVLRVIDVEKKIGCDPLSVFQGHALWHVFTGMSAFFLYWFYRNETA